MKLIHELELGELPRHRLVLETGPHSSLFGDWTEKGKIAWITLGGRTFGGEMVGKYSREFEATWLKVQTVSVEGRLEG